MTFVAARARAPSPWLHAGGDPDGIAVCTRVRFARAVAGRPFRRTLSNERQREVVRDVLAACATALPGEAQGMDLEGLDAIERQALVERRLASRDLASGKHPGGLHCRADETLAVMANEEDHVRLQAFAPGLDADQPLAAAIAADEALGRLLHWAVHPAYGHLTACHTNLGTGMRVSVMLHLPALDETGEIKQVLRGCEKLFLAVRGSHGEGSEPGAHLYQISNLRSLGQDETAIARQVAAAAARIREAELLARMSLLNRSRTRLEDRAWRAWALLAHARTLTWDETAEQLGWLQLGLALGVLGAPATVSDRPAIDALWVLAQPAHLQLAHPGAGDAEVRDLLRADLVRAALSR